MYKDVVKNIIVKCAISLLLLSPICTPDNAIDDRTIVLEKTNRTNISHEVKAKTESDIDIGTQKPYRILVVIAPESKSHLRSMLPVLNRLAEAGHQVNIFHISSEKDDDEKFAANISLIRVPFQKEKFLDNKVQQIGMRIWRLTTHSPWLAVVYEMIGRGFDEILLPKHSDKIAETLNSQWDLVLISELFNLHGYGFAQLLHERAGVPIVVFCPSMMMPSAAYDNSIGQNWISHPHPTVPTPQHSKDVYDPGNFFTRLVNVLETLGEFCSRIIINKVVIASRLVHLTGKHDFTFARLFAQSEMVMVDSIAHLGLPQPEANEVLNAGAHCEQAAELSDEYKQFVEDPTSKGTIYVAFGTSIPWDYAPPRVIAAFFDAFERLPDYRIVFSYKGKFPSRKLSLHIRLVGWAPQLDLLAHPKTLVFLTHCGLKSIKESLCTRTPMLAMPMFAEQNHNALMVLQFGTGIALNKYAIDANLLETSLRELLENRKYMERVEKVQQMFLDRPANALDEAEFRVSRILRKGRQRAGRHFFKRTGVKMNFSDSFYLHWALALIVLICIVSK